MTESNNKNVSNGSSCGCKGKTVFFLSLFVGFIFGFSIGIVAHDNVVRSYVKLINNFTKTKQLEVVSGSKKTTDVERTESAVTEPEQNELKKDEEKETEKSEDKDKDKEKEKKTDETGVKPAE